jgi:hypothetical protein
MTTYNIEPLVAWHDGNGTCVIYPKTDAGRAAAEVITWLPREQAEFAQDGIVAAFKKVGPEGNLRPDGTLAETVLVLPTPPLIAAMPARMFIGFEEDMVNAPEIALTPELERLSDDPEAYRVPR